ncbi:hypothetical protein C2I18_08125 [Paenibacillus sp. PK3_47]|uniref:DUF5345 family protein n=1 Tax=Paenibacillus sp. PK3_47 TaxID=2072642 RepID=UPI00201E6609|nr:DUF5345 family protein [Paenibacillus sp. PK3_47]UQZ33511.1 hypothetical protein C2I18_08125 [Paenibacillus sp. PK3_47]
MKPDNEEELLRRLNSDLARLDAQIDNISPPSLPEMEHFMAAEAVRRRRQSRMELKLFLLVALFLLGAALTALGSAPVIYWIFQAAFPLAALSGFIANRIRLRREDADK